MKIENCQKDSFSFGKYVEYLEGICGIFGWSMWNIWMEYVEYLEGVCGIFGRNMCQNAYFLCLQGMKMRRFTNKRGSENRYMKRIRKQIFDQLKRRNNSQRINSMLFLEFSLKLICKNKC